MVWTGDFVAFSVTLSIAKLAQTCFELTRCSWRRRCRRWPTIFVLKIHKEVRRQFLRIPEIRTSVTAPLLQTPRFLNVLGRTGLVLGVASRSDTFAKAENKSFLLIGSWKHSQKNDSIKAREMCCIRSQGNYYCLPPAGVLHSQNKIIKCAAYGVAQRRGWRYVFITVNDMYNNDVGKKSAINL